MDAENLSFHSTPDEIEKASETRKSQLTKIIDSIAKTPSEKATFENTLLLLETACSEFSDALTPIMFLKYISSDEKVRAAADKCETSVSQMFVDIFVREDLFAVIKSVKDSAQKLPSENSQLLDEYLINFKRNGLALEPEKRKVFIEKKKRLVLLESEFSNNLASEKGFLAVTREELEGLSDSYISNLEKTDEGKYKITLDYPRYFPFMENAKNAGARKSLELKFNLRGGLKNKALLEEAIRTRDEMAQLLGYATHADFVLERRMAKKPDEVRKFLDDLSKKLIPKGRAELKELSAFKKEVTQGRESDEIAAWDFRYYENLQKKTRFQVDSELIREYFPLNTVLKGLFEIYETLLNVTFVEDAKASKWHESVRKYRVSKDGETVAFFFYESFPREGKYGHAAAFTLLHGYRKSDGTYQTPVSSIVANFNPPSAGGPSLMEHSEVETLFHEFGHIMHQVLTRARYATFAGTNVKTDYVEAPSQMLENWVWQKEALDKLSGHYKDPSKKLPAEQVQKLLNVKHLNVALHYLRQLAFATLDMAYHTAREVDTTAIYAKTVRGIMLIPIQEGALPQASFGHLMGGYDAGYYSYLWSEVYAQDMFTRFEKDGLLNPATGAEYRQWILEPGGEKDPIELVRGFLKREPNNEAFLKGLGL